MVTHRILVVEDDHGLRDVLARGLREDGYDVHTAADGSTAVRHASMAAVDAIVLDVALPDADGRDVCIALRSRGVDVPVLFLTARDGLTDRVAGFAAGGDDYVTKPFAFVELSARLRALLRRTANPTRSWGDLELDPSAHALRCGDVTTPLSPTEFRLLAKLLSAPERVVRRAELVSAGWPAGAVVSDNTLDQYVSKLRRKLRRVRSRHVIDAARGVGSASCEMRSRQRTLRGRVSAVGLLVVAAWLLLLTVAVNVILAQRLARDVDSRLRTRAIAVAATVQLAPHGRLRVNEPAADDVLDSGIWIFGHGQTVEAPPGQDTVARAARRIANGPGGFATADGNIRLYAQPVTRSRRRVATVVTALSTTASHRSRDEALVGSIALALLAMAGAYAALRWTAARALQPVARMTHHAAELSATRMAERFDTHQRFAELDELATTFNDALDRQAAAVRHERQLLADLSHELRTPLTRIVAETDLLLARSHATAATDTAHRNIRASAMTMNRIIETLLSTSRVDNLAATGSCRLDVAVNAVLQQRATYTAGHSSLAWALDVPCLAVGAEAAVVERILAPILDNAERYAATTIRITADRNEHSVVIDVDDDGPGVDAQVAEEIFTPGRQFGYPAPAGGAGLGLPLARRLARATGGDVTHPGGSTFRILLPPA